MTFSNIALSESNISLIISILDLTRLEPDDSDDDIKIICNKATTQYGNVAAVCVLPEFVTLAKRQLPDTGVKVTATANFPLGESNLENTLAEIEKIFLDGADEVDVVMPYKALIAGDVEYVNEFVNSCRSQSSGYTMKLILETGCLTEVLIKQASELAIEANVDFIKTSTGKVDIGATPDAAKCILRTIEAGGKTTTGIKLSGGITTAEQAMLYIKLAQSIMGEGWVSRSTFRIGGSSLLDNLLEVVR